MALEGCTVLVLESRFPAVLADLISRCGGQAVVAPAVVEVEAPASEVAEPLAALCRGAVDVAMLQTGVGTDRLHRQAGELGMTEAFGEVLRRLPLVVRGPKPAAVLHRWGVFIQHYGEINESLRAFVAGRAAVPVDALPYRWAIPEGSAPLRRAVERYGVPAAVEPQHGKMAPLVRALDAYVPDRRGHTGHAEGTDDAAR